MSRLLIILILFCGLTDAYSQEFTFSSTSDDILKSLTEDKAEKKVPFKTRSLRNINAVEKKSIVILESNELGEFSKKRLKLDDDTPKRNANLLILFDVNSHKIKEESIGLLNELGVALSHKSLQGKTISINGHTDSDGEEEYNLNLSIHRAYEILKYLKSNYNLVSDIRVKGYGESLPLLPNSTEEKKKLNRRVEIVVLSK